jgi:membrane associated rhomboid family serine protease
MFIPLFDVNPHRGRPVTNYVLLGANLIAWLWQLGMQEMFGASAVVTSYGLVPGRLLGDPSGEVFTVLTSMFMHGGWAHLGGNLLFLYVFGDNVENALGHLRYFGFYLLGGVGAAAAQVFVDPSSAVPMVGASGAIASVLGAYVVLYPKAAVGMLNTVFLLWPLLGIVFYVPAWIAIGTWFLWNVVGGFSHMGLGYGDGVAYFAHIGGFVAGLLIVRLFAAQRSAGGVDPWEGWREKPRSTRDGDGNMRGPWG